MAPGATSVKRSASQNRTTRLTCSGVLLDSCSSWGSFSLFRLWSDHAAEFSRQFKGKFQRTVSGVRISLAPPASLPFSAPICSSAENCPIFRRVSGCGRSVARPRERFLRLLRRGLPLIFSGPLPGCGSLRSLPRQGNANSGSGRRGLCCPGRPLAETCRTCQRRLTILGLSCRSETPQSDSQGRRPVVGW